MTFITGMILIDAPASALNNSGEKIPGAREENTSATKYIQTPDGKTYPYVSAQAVRYWLRRTLEANDINWKYLPPFRGDKIAFTDGNPILWWDDDLMGYMRASDKEEDEKAAITAGLTPRSKEKRGKKDVLVTLTRAAPFRLSTLVSVSPVRLVNDFGVMARQHGDPVPFEHNFYRTTLHGLFSLDLGMAGKFYYQRRTGFQNLDEVRRKMAEEQGLKHLADEQAYQLPVSERLKRICSLMLGMGQLEGGAKQTIHYTDVSPAVIIAAVTKGGNHPFNYLFGETRGITALNEQVLQRALEAACDTQQLLSSVYIGWKPGFLPDSEAIAHRVKEEFSDSKASTDESSDTGKSERSPIPIQLSHPLDALGRLTKWLEENIEIWDK